MHQHMASIATYWWPRRDQEGEARSTPGQFTGIWRIHKRLPTLLHIDKKNFSLRSNTCTEANRFPNATLYGEAQLRTLCDTLSDLWGILCPKAEPTMSKLFL